jgi:hypothetical protein
MKLADVSCPGKSESSGFDTIKLSGCQKNHQREIQRSKWWNGY